MSLHIPRPELIEPYSVPILRWGIFGTGWISEEFATSANSFTPQDVITVASRTPGKAKDFAKKCGLPEFDDSYESLAARDDIDVIYIATRPVDHLEHAMIAINAGKHVLIEKPIAVTPDDAQRIFTAAKSAGVFAMEAMWNRYLPQASVVRKILSSGLIGKPELMLVDFCQDQRSDSRKWDPGHGTIMFDMGIYPISFALEILGAPTNIQAFGQLHENGTEAEATVRMDFASGSRAIFTLSGLTHAPHHATIACTEGVIEYQTPFVIPSGISLFPSGFNQSGEIWLDDFEPRGHQGLCYEATALAKYVSEGLAESPLHPHFESVLALEIVHEILDQLGATHITSQQNPNLSFKHTTHLLM